MRTVILMSGIAIVGSINKDWITESDNDVILFFQVVLISFFIMAVIEFFKRLSK